MGKMECLVQTDGTFDENNIQVGDFVIVPAGKDNYHSIAEVVAIERFAKEDAPFPPEKTKYIVRRCKNKKNDINGLWMNTEYGQWVLLASKGKIQEANELLKKIQSKPLWNIEQVSKELNVQIAKAFDSIDDFEDYLRLLEKDDYNLVDFIISHDVFGKVYEILM